jgi:hypothetical protein
MSTLVILAPQYFPLSATGAPAGGGSLYIGEPDTDPTDSDNQITVQALLENGNLQTLSQPITLSGGGIPLYNGSPVSLYVSQSYSMTVKDINGAQIYYVPDSPQYIISDTIDLTGPLNVETEITSEVWPVSNNLAQFDGNDPAGIEDSGESVSTIGVLDTPAEWTGQQTSDEAAITSSSNSVAWNVNTAQAALHTLTENTTIAAPTNLKQGGFYSLRVVQAAGVYTLAFNAIFDWGAASAPSAPAADGDQILLTFYYDGTNMLGVESHRKEA